MNRQKKIPPFGGNKELMQWLEEAAKERRISHTLILSAPAGAERDAAAMEIAKYILCPEMASDADHLDCVCCRKVDQRIHPDLIILRADNKSGTLSVQKLREELVATLPVFPHEAEKKVYYLADRMLPAAQNLLLKSLEEPPFHTHFILGCEMESEFLTTVRSRSVHLHLSPLTWEEMKEILPEASKQELLFALSGGYLSRATELGEEKVQKAERLIEMMLSALLSRKEYDFLAALEQAEKQKCTEFVLRGMVWLLRGTLGLNPPLEGTLSPLQSRCRQDWSVSKRTNLLALCNRMLAPQIAGRNQMLKMTSFAASLFS